MIVNQARNLLLLLPCCLRFLIFGKSNKKISNPKKVVIVQLAKLGDMVCTTPMFRAVKVAYPNCKVFVIGDSVNEKLLEGNNDVDESIVFNENLIETIKKLKKIKPDFACITTPKFSILAVLYLAGIKSIAVPVIKNGWCPFETRSYKFLARAMRQVPHHFGSYAPREYLKLLQPINIFTDNTLKHLSLSKPSKDVVDSYFIKNNINPESDFVIGMSPSAGNKIKNWGGQKFAKLAEYLHSNYRAKIIITGTKNDEEEITEMFKKTNRDVQLFNAQGVFNVGELKALVSVLDLYISVDTGPIYIAEAFGIPTIDIIGPMDESEQPPIGNIHKLVFIKDRIKPELHIMNARIYNKDEARRQIDDISVDMVVDQFKKMLPLLNINNKIK